MLLNGCEFLPALYEQADVQSTMGLLFFVAINQGILGTIGVLQVRLSLRAKEFYGAAEWSELFVALDSRMFFSIKHNLFSQVYTESVHSTGDRHPRSRTYGIATFWFPYYDFRHFFRTCTTPRVGFSICRVRLAVLVLFSHVGVISHFFVDVVVVAGYRSEKIIEYLFFMISTSRVSSISPHFRLCFIVPLRLS